MEKKSDMSYLSLNGTRYAKNGNQYELTTERNYKAVCECFDGWIVLLAVLLYNLLIP